MFQVIKDSSTTKIRIRKKCMQDNCERDVYEMKRSEKQMIDCSHIHNNNDILKIHEVHVMPIYQLTDFLRNTKQKFSENFNLKNV